MPALEIIFYLLLFIVAFLYASVGHGGASGYLALMAFYSYSPEIMRPSALILNIFVSLVAFALYYRSGYFQWKLFWPFAIASIPAAYMGGLVNMDSDIYRKVLGALLILPVIRLAVIDNKTKEYTKDQNIPASIIIGAVIGLLSGMLGIGGGIILSPVILLLHWADMKQTAAVSALFILVNSLAGLSGVFSKGFDYDAGMILMILIALAGGLTGSFLGSKRFESNLLKRILAAVLLIASIKLLIT